MKILAVVDELIPDAPGELEAVLQADLKLPRVVEANAIDRAPYRRGVAPVRVDDQQPLKTGADEEAGDLANRRRQRFRKQRDRAWPAVGVPERAAVLDCRQHRHA